MNEPIHVAVVRTVKPGCESEFQQALREFFQTSLAHSGVLGATMIVPPPASDSREFGILRTLLEARGRVLTRGQLIDSVRAADTHITERTVDTHVRRIRAKLRPHGFDPIETVHGLGYKAAAPPT